MDLCNTNCTDCGLSRFRKNVIISEGPLDAKIVLVGEGPGLEENDTGKPFVGPAGRELTKILFKAGIDRSSIFMTNVVRCIAKAPPPKNVRPPSDEEIAACNKYLEKELETIKPTIIVPMGNVALKAVMGSKGASITKYRGREIWSDKYNCKIMPVFHPAGILRQMSQEAITVEDFIRIKEASKFREMTKHEEGTYVTIDTLDLFDQFVSKITTQPEFSFDIETTGLNWQKDKVILISFTWKERTATIVPLIKYKPREEEYTELKIKKVKQKIDGKSVTVEKEVPVTGIRVIDEYEDFWGDKQAYVLEKLKEVLGNQAEKIAHNGKFDIKFLIQLGLPVNNFTFDTMLAHYLLDENAIGRHGLKDCALSYTDMGAYDEALDLWFKERHISDEKKNYAQLPTELLYKYAGADTDCTFRLKNIFAAQLQKEDLRNFFDRLIMPLSDTLMWGEINGVQVDTKYLKELKAELTLERETLFKQLCAGAGKEINFNSTKQLRDLFFNQLKYPVVKHTKGGKSGIQSPATDEEALSIWAAKGKGFELATLMLDYRRVGKLLNTYVEGIEAALDDQGRIHTTYLIHGTVTGRLSSREPNLQNIPRDDKRIKRLFVARPGWALIEADLGQAEFRIWAQYSKDEKMITDIKAATDGSGPDVHKLTASEVMHIPLEEVTKKQRQQAKNTVFGLMYGRGAKSLAEEHGMSVYEAEKIIKHFFSKYPRAEKWLHDVVATVKAYQQVRNLFGRIRRLPTIQSPDEWIRAEAERQAKNSPIQSAASDMTCNAANRIKLRFVEEQLSGIFCLQVHDSLTYEVPLNELEKSLNIIKEEMERPVRDMIVPIVAEFKVGDRLGLSPEWTKINNQWYRIDETEDKKTKTLVEFKELVSL
jgi:uracil-DNA glycosylase family 4